jgi:hypothetical protein
MERSGVVAAINRSRGMVAIETQDDGYTIIELLSEFDIELGDEIVWNGGHALGSETYRNATKGVSENVYVQNHGVSRTNLRRQLRL